MHFSIQSFLIASYTHWFSIKQAKNVGVSMEETLLFFLLSSYSQAFMKLKEQTRKGGKSFLK